MADQTQRLEIATVRAEVGSNIVYRFANDAVGADQIPTQSGPIQNLKQVILELQEEASEKISISTTIYTTVAAGLAASADQEIFLVQSNDADEIYAVWKNEAGTAVNTGKTALSATAIQTALDASNEAAQAAEDAADVATERTAGFLAPSATAPVLRDNGMPLQPGDRYFNTVEQAEYIYKADGWEANDSLQAIADLQNSTDPEKGASQIGWDGEPVSAQMDLSKRVLDYAALRSYAGTATRLEVVKAGIFGTFLKKPFASGDADNNGTTLVSTDGQFTYTRVFNGDFDVRWFGAQLAGGDDSAAVQACINSAPIGSKIVIAATPAGALLSGLVVNKQVHIIADEANLKQKAGSTAPMITYLGVDGFRLRGLRANGNKANQATQTNVIEVKNCSNFRITDVDIDGASYCGLKIDGNVDAHPTRSYLRRVQAIRSGYTGILLYNARRLNLQDCNSSDNGGYGVLYDSSIAEAGSDIVISDGNYDYNVYAGICFPYFDYTGLLGKCLKVQIKGASVCNNTSNGMILQGKDKSVAGGCANNNSITGILVNGKQCSVVGVELKYNGSVGIDWGDCEDITCTGNSAFGNGDMGIEVNSCLRGVVTGNTVNGNNTKINGIKAGIVLHLGTGGYPFTGPSSGIAVTGNYVGPGPNQDYGILLTGDTSDNVVDANACTGSGAAQDIRCISGYNTIKPGASRASHRGSLTQITIATAATVTIPDAAEVIYLTGSVNVSTITGGNLSAGREITLVFSTSVPQILNTGNILTAVNPVANWRPIRLTYIKSLEKWAVMETKTF